MYTEVKANYFITFQRNPYQGYPYVTRPWFAWHFIIWNKNK